MRYNGVIVNTRVIFTEKKLFPHLRIRRNCSTATRPEGYSMQPHQKQETIILTHRSVTMAVKGTNGLPAEE